MKIKRCVKYHFFTISRLHKDSLLPCGYGSGVVSNHRRRRSVRGGGSSSNRGR